MLMMICAKYDKKTSRIVDLFQSESQKIEVLEFCYKLKMQHTL